MDNGIIAAVVAELEPLLVNRSIGRVVQFSRATIAIDFRLTDGRHLLIGVDPARPRIHLIARPVRDLEKQAAAPSPFVLVLRKRLGGARLGSIAKDEGDRIVRLHFLVADELGQIHTRFLIAQLTGRTANLFLLDGDARIIDSLRPSHGPGQEIGETYQPPPVQQGEPQRGERFSQEGFASLSEAADDYYRQLDRQRVFEQLAASARERTRKALAQRTRLYQNLKKDLATHADAEGDKRIGDLLLANLSTAKREGNTVTLTDYFAEGIPSISLDIDEHSTLQQEAARRFARYSKAKRAREQIERRLREIEIEIAALEARQLVVEESVRARDEAALKEFAVEEQVGSARPRAPRKPDESLSGVRRYRSSDGYEIMVGRAAHDNDRLTFRMARPHDLWLHAADYPGSHVVIRNPTRAEVPHRTIIEAAQLAAHFSQARRDSKVDVHYTQRKFLTKPKGAAPGLVRMSSFRTLTVEPRESVGRI